MKCLKCKNDFQPNYPSQKFCGRVCSASYTTKGRKHSTGTKEKIRKSMLNYNAILTGETKPEKYCKICKKILMGGNITFCSNKCMKYYHNGLKVKQWQEGKIDGNCKSGYAGFIKRYLLEKYDNKCSVCGWGETNTFTKTIPLEVEHIDGDAYNNKPDKE